MSVCVAVAPDGVLSLDLATPFSGCSYVLISSNEYTSIAGLNDLFSQYFAFDSTMFELVFGSFMIAFVSGHVLGRVISGLRKAG
ncbi:hypothetical protein [Candidatus Methylobacter oryzae]|uniref:Uncharacterized protein n=1 Tax=Candidatus Methylobacter oryzae TaxID=2497749 RepID=A0ABY3CCR3_9GAMM|nr:hypothetical protein [Candidatus Methylobacter oryzae]TRW99832.1 hypothetical protein EKO24_006530 [Candidatus Methylobacter oryzae]